MDDPPSAEAIALAASILLKQHGTEALGFAQQAMARADSQSAIMWSRIIAAIKLRQQEGQEGGPDLGDA